jgi:tetratricopeptide (TPR) repeat protein
MIFSFIMVQFRTLLLAPLLFLAVLVHAQQGGDLEAQILYAYDIEDANELASLVQTLSTQEQGGGVDTAFRYHLAHARYRLGLLAGEAHGHNAEVAFAACVDEFKSQDLTSADALALQGACYGNLAHYRTVERVLLRARAEARLGEAARLGPRNPRVLYLTAVNDFSHAKPATRENVLAFGKLQLAVQVFEDSSATDPDAPAWGHAEAYLEMGRQLQARGDLLGARNWIEKALLIAPDFKAAQRQLATVLRR